MTEKHPLAWKGGDRVLELHVSSVPIPLFPKCRKWDKMDKPSVCTYLGRGKSMNAFHDSICTSVTKNIELH